MHICCRWEVMACYLDDFSLNRRVDFGGYCLGSLETSNWSSFLYLYPLPDPNATRTRTLVLCPGFSSMVLMRGFLVGYQVFVL